MQVADLEGFRLSIQQTRLWSLQKRMQVYGPVCAVSIEGQPDKEAFEKALQLVILRHEILRTLFYSMPGMDIPVQAIASHPTYSHTVIDLQNVGAEHLEIEDWITSLQTRHVDTQHMPLVRSWLLHLVEKRFLWIVSLPALCADASTLRLFVSEFQHCYAPGFQGEQLDNEPLQYADVSSWQDSLLQDEDATLQLQYWREKDLSLLKTMRLPFEQGSPVLTVQESSLTAFVPRTLPVELDNQLVQQIKAVVEDYDVSMAAFLLACWQAVYWRLGAESHFLIGVACDGRIYEELTNAMGLYTRFVPVDAFFEKDLPFAQLLSEVALSLEEALEKQLYFTWETASPKNGQPDSWAFFPVCFEYDNWPDAFTAHELTWSVHKRLSRSEPYALKLSALQIGEHVHIELDYAAARVGSEQAQKIARTFHRLLSSAVEQPTARVGLLDILWPEELNYILNTFRGRSRSQSEQTLHELFEVQSARFPQQLAIIDAQTSLTYQELNCATNQLARILRRYGVDANVPVGLCTYRSGQMILCLLAILKAGGAYVPLDPENPPARLAFQLRDSQARLLLTQQEFLPLFSSWEGTPLCLETLVEEMRQESDANVPARTTAQDLAYIMYTSGSTGLPKGVAILQQSVVHYTLALCEQLQSQPGWHYTTVSTLAADLGNTAIFCALASGGCLHIPDYETITSGEAFAHWASQHPLDVLKIVPSHLLALLTARQPAGVLPRRALLLGGEALPTTLLRLLREPGCRCAIYNHYGPTETTIGVLVNALGIPDHAGKYAEVAQESGTVPLGRPLGNSEVYVLDPRGQIVPIGVTGELTIGGVGLASGYVQQPALTAERFVPHPFDLTAGARLYRTGDLARYRPDGTIEYLGRHDEQVKLRGFRIELGEIAEQMRRIPTVREATVLLWQDEEHKASLVGYIVPRQKPGPELEEVQQALREHLPAYMIPVSIVILEQMPLTANGKLDRRRLPAPVQARLEEHELCDQARTPIEEILLDIWKELLGIGQINRMDNFFRLGGHSLLGTRVIARLRSAFRIEMPITTLFEAPTIAQLAEKVEVLLRGQRFGTIPPLKTISRTEILPLSFAQQRLWFLHQLDPYSVAYHVPGAVRLQGKVHICALHRSFEALFQRHESLRTTFAEHHGQLVQHIETEMPLPFFLVDLSACQPHHRERELQALLQQEAYKPFDLSCGPLCRTLLLKLDSQEYVLALTMHHIVSDGWSMSILVRELAALYRAFLAGAPSPLPQLPIQYADYAVWQRQWLQGDVLQAHVRYWTYQLSEARALELPGDYPRSQIISHRGARYSFQIGANLAQGLVDLSRQAGATLFMTLLTAFQILLYRLSRQQDIVVGTDSANRAYLETESIIGFFVNLLALRTHVTGKSSFNDLLTQVREMVLEAYMHQDLPFETIVEHLRLPRQSHRTLLVNVLFVMQNVPPISLELPGLSVNVLENNTATAKFDLAIFIAEGPAGLQGTVNYSTDLFRETTIAAMMSSYEVLLGDILAHPESQVDHLDIYTEDEKQLRNLHKKKRLEGHLSKLKGFQENFIDLP